MVVRIQEVCMAIQRRCHKALWNGGAILPTLALYNIFEQHNIHSTLVCGYYQPPVYFLQAQARAGSSSAAWLPHIWIEVDGYQDPLIDIYSIGGNVVGFCQLHDIDPQDQSTFYEKAREVGLDDPDKLWREITVCGGAPTASKVLGKKLKSIDNKTVSKNLHCQSIDCHFIF